VVVAGPQPDAAAGRAPQLGCARASANLSAQFLCALAGRADIFPVHGMTGRSPTNGLGFVLWANAGCPQLNDR
jgi:hypothetical protein